DGNDICFGLVALKGVGDAAIDSIVETREESGSFASLQDFCERVDTKQVNKRAVESLIMSGAFDSLEGHRAQYLASLENIMKAAQNAQAERDRGQMSLFGDGEEAPTATVALVAAPELDPLERLMREKEQLGFYVSGHPLEEYGDIIENYTSTSTQNLGENRIDSEVDVAGMITEVNNHTTKKGEAMAVIELEDLEDTVKVVVFPDAYKNAVELVEGKVVWIRGTVKLDNRNRNSDSDEDTHKEALQIQANKILDIESVAEQQTSALEVMIPEADLENTEKLEALQEIARANRGDHDLILRLMSSRYGEVIARCAQKYNIAYKPQIIEQVEGLFGENCIKPSNRTIRGKKNRTSQMDFV
ncbi:MAG: OB-fold nucleic acid binding domain-containing protein, partial [Candidatus Poribacteria bacterium]|nr:OB-fold nucleic acid binding domain-containing protein [Candidatus Poribacteria bacterium]